MLLQCKDCPEHEKFLNKKFYELENIVFKEWDSVVNTKIIIMSIGCIWIYRNAQCRNQWNWPHTHT